MRLGPDPICKWKSQLNEYLETYTKGLARETVDSRGEHGALDAWGSLADRAHSLREENVQQILLKAYGPKTSVAAKNLESAIASWEIDVRNLQDATGEKFPERNRRLGLINMCPDRLREYLRAYGKDRFESYELIKREVVDWLADEVRRNKSSGRAAALGEKDPGGAAEEEPWPEEVDWSNIDEENM